MRNLAEHASKRSIDAQLLLRVCVLAHNRTKPQRGMRRLHRLSRDGDQTLLKLGEVEFLAEASGKCGDGRARIVFTAIEAAVDFSLEGAPHWLKQRGDRKCGADDDQ